MIPYLLAIAGGYLIGSARKEGAVDKKYSDGGIIIGDRYIASEDVKSFYGVGWNVRTHPTIIEKGTEIEVIGIEKDLAKPIYEVRTIDDIKKYGYKDEGGWRIGGMGLYLEQIKSSFKKIKKYSDGGITFKKGDKITDGSNVARKDSFQTFENGGVVKYIFRITQYGADFNPKISKNISIRASSQQSAINKLRKKYPYPWYYELQSIEEIPKYAKGGLTYYPEQQSYRYSPSRWIEKDLLNKVNYDINDFVGNFGWKTPQGTRAEGYLFKLDDFDKNLVKNVSLKEGDKIFRYFNRTTAVSGSKPLIKININKRLIYFLKDSDNDEIIFETRGIDCLYLNLIEGISGFPNDIWMAMGGSTTKDYEVFIEYLNKEKKFQKDRKYFSTYEQAVKWGRKNISNFKMDMIQYT